MDESHFRQFCNFLTMVKFCRYFQGVVTFRTSWYIVLMQHPILRSNIKIMYGNMKGDIRF